MDGIASINTCPRRTSRSRPMRALAYRLSTALVLGFGTVIAAPAAAQAYPSKAVRLVVPFAAGGVTDVMARLIGGEMARHLGQPVTVDNRAGAGGAIAAEHVAKSPADGYTLCFCTTGPMALIPILDARLPYDPLRDLAPVSHLHNVDNVIIARPTLPANTVAELVALARSNPDKLTYGTPGIGGPQHLSGELLNTMAGIRLVHVPFKGEAPSITDLMGGQIDLVFASVLAAVPHIKSGKVKAVAVPHRTRAELLPDVPTVAEGLTPVGSRPEAYAAFLRSEHQKWSGVIKQAGLTRQ
jgi:tripartite-type tricarboxylate transporter receptor subunit TctC